MTAAVLMLWPIHSNGVTSSASVLSVGIAAGGLVLLLSAALTPSRQGRD